MTTSVLATSPEELRLAARRLAALGGELQGLAARIDARAHPGDGWGGVAAVQHLAVTRRAAVLVREAGVPGEEVARALQGVAEVAEDTSGRVVAWTRRAEDALAEVVALRAAGIPPDPQLAEAWRQRVLEAEEQVDRARALVRGAEAEFDLAQQRVAQVVAGAWAALHEAQRLKSAFDKARMLGRRLPWFAVHTVHTTRMVVELARSRWAREAAARALALTRARESLQLLTLRMSPPPPGAGRLARALAGPHPVALGLSWFAALGDVRSGGGYEGWRGTVTQGLAGVALVGGVVAVGGLMFGGLPTPVGVLMVETYALWMAGNVVWDNRKVVMRYARLAVDRGLDLARDVRSAAARAGVRVGARLLDLRARALRAAPVLALAAGSRIRSMGDVVGDTLAPLRDPRRWVIGLPPGVHGLELPDVPEVLQGLADRVPGSDLVREQLRQTGVPIRLPGLPLGPVIRAPVDLGLPWFGEAA